MVGRGKVWLTPLGRVEVRRNCHRWLCDRGRFPLERVPDLEGETITSGITSVIVWRTMLEMGFRAASLDVADLAGISIPSSS